MAMRQILPYKKLPVMYKKEYDDDYTTIQHLNKNNEIKKKYEKNKINKRSKRNTTSQA